MKTHLMKLMDASPELTAIVDEALAEGRRIHLIAHKCGKVCYGHEETAKTAADIMHKKTGEEYEVYECLHCNAWHIGHGREQGSAAR